MLIAVLPLLSLAPGYAHASPVACATWSAPAQGTDFQGLLRQELERAEQPGPIDAIWRSASRLRDAARELGVEDIDAALERALANAERGPRAKLALVAARLEGADAAAAKAKLAEALVALLGSKDEALLRAACGLAANTTFRTLEGETRRGLLDRLHGLAEDATRTPALRLDAAFAEGRIGMGDDVRKARGLMGEFLESGDAELRALGALALARSGAEVSGKLLDELERLAVAPDERGLLAQAYLERERTREVGERKLKNLAELQRLEAGEMDPAAPSNEEFDRLKNLMAMIRRAHPDGGDVTRDELLEAAMQGMLQSLDEHSSYLDPKVYERFEQDLAAGYGGIGAYVGEDRQDGLFTITRPIYSGPAYKAGLMSEDKIVRIDDWPTLGKPTDEIIKRLKGRPGTKVRLYVWRRGMDSALVDRPTEGMVVEVERGSITIPAEQHQMLPGKIGMIVLQEFSQVASRELRGPLEELLAAGMEGLVLDLRNNSGGLLEEAVNVSGLFLPKGTLVVSTKSPLRETEKLSTRSEPVIPPDMPIVVLVNRFTASAAEIVSGALQDHRRAVVIGERSFGKGSVQSLMQLPPYRDDQYSDENRNGRWDNWEKITRDWDGDGEFDFAPRVKLTIARYYLPTDRSIHREVDKDGNLLNSGGVSPDTAVAASRLEAWRVEAMLKLRDQHKPREYVDRNWAEHKDLFSRLADNDRKETSLYPGFDEFYADLKTPLSPDDVRQMLRAEIRRRVQDARGQEFPQGDFVEDLQLQAGIRRVFESLGRSVADVDEYRATIQPDNSPRLAVAQDGKARLRDALDALNSALKADRRLSESTLRELVEVIGDSLKN
ncbi:MAG: S41 family peptidase [Planctomycetes bacterium]|nr:S41 family peptidase [Planctomycetota bacterium]